MIAEWATLACSEDSGIMPFSITFPYLRTDNAVFEVFQVTGANAPTRNINNNIKII